MTTIELCRLQEKTVQTNTRVDRQAGVIRGVRIIGRTSRNGRTYSDAALEQLKTMYEGISVNVDHPARHSPGTDRSLADRFGQLKNVSKRADGIYADLFYSRSHALAEHIADLAENFPNQLGLSHNAEGTIARYPAGDIVETVECVHSVDLVCNPATNVGLFESEGDRPILHPANIKTGIAKALDSAVVLIAQDSTRGPGQTGRDVDAVERMKRQVFAELDRLFPIEVDSDMAPIERDETGRLPAAGVSESYSLARAAAFPNVETLSEAEEIRRAAFPSLFKRSAKKTADGKSARKPESEMSYGEAAAQAFPSINR